MRTIVLPALAMLAGLFRGRALLHLEILALRQAPGHGEPVAATTGPVSLARTVVLDLALPPMAWLSRNARGLQAGHAGALAPQGVSTLLELEVAALGRSAADLAGDPHAHSSDIW